MVKFGRAGTIRSSYIFGGFPLTVDAINYFIPVGTNEKITVEADAQIPITEAIIITKLIVNISVNQKDQNSTLAFRDDGVSVASITFGTGVTGIRDSGAIDVTIVAGSSINWFVDVSLSLGLSLTMDVFVAEWKSA